MAETTMIKEYVEREAARVLRSPSKMLRYPYLVPAGPYEQLWDWDSVFTGVGLFPFGSAPYLAGSMMNFLDWTNEDSGEVEGIFSH
mmetsp:Transcript_46525/g.75943  ORF Transcript_46525/g.75943 Transcript_46525/m.75943 type:complete len:86 (+) Transcript_46525:46-303(+)